MLRISLTARTVSVALAEHARAAGRTYLAHYRIERGESYEYVTH